VGHSGAFAVYGDLDARILFKIGHVAFEEFGIFAAIFRTLDIHFYLLFVDQLLPICRVRLPKVA
jgi:hypothetical protein